MSVSRPRVLSLPVVVVLGATAVAAVDAHAAGYYVGEIGARSMARGGANIVNPEDPSAMWLNPAAITLSKGVQLNIDLNLVWLGSEFVRDCGGEDNGCAINDSIERTYVRDGDAVPERVFAIEGGRRQVGAQDSSGAVVNPAEPGRLGNLNRPSRFDGETAVTNQAGVQPIPRLFATFNSDVIGIDGFALGVFVYAPSAGAYSFAADAPTRYTLIDRSIYELYYGLSAGYRFSDYIAVGGSFQLVSSGLNQTLSLTADTVGNEDENYDVTVHIVGDQHFIPSGNFGIWSNPGKLLGIGDLEVAASVQLPRAVKTQGPITIEKFGERLQQDFIDSGLAAINDDGATASAEFVMPPFYRVGLKYGSDDVFGDGQKTLGFDVEADVVYEAWSTYDHVFLTTQDLTFSVGGGEPEPLPPIIQPKDWQDAISVRLGGTVALWDKALELHGGGFYETSAIPNTTHSIELVDGDKVGVAAGVSGTWNGLRLDVAYGHVFVFDRVVGSESIVTAGNVEVPPPVGAEGELRTRIAMGTYRAGYDMLNISVTAAFDDLFNFGAHAVRPAPAPPAPEPAAPVEDTSPPEVAPTPTPAVDAPAPDDAGADTDDPGSGDAGPTILRVLR